MKISEILTGFIFFALLFVMAALMTFSAATEPVSGYCAEPAICETNLTTTINGVQY